MMDIECEQFLSQVQALATIFDSVLVTVYLEKEQDVVFVDFSVAIVFLQELLYLFLYTNFFSLSNTA